MIKTREVGDWTWEEFKDRNDDNSAGNFGNKGTETVISMPPSTLQSGNVLGRVFETAKYLPNHTFK